MILLNEQGDYIFYNSKAIESNETEVAQAGTSFFLPAYHKIMSMYWSTGNVNEESELEEVQKIDLRSQYLLFNFEVRTEDNVRLQLEGTIFWQVMDAEIMIKKT